MKDGNVRRSLEQVSNNVSRRKFLKFVTKGVFATLTASTLGKLSTREVFAGNFLCCNQEGAQVCPGCPSYTYSCPPGYSLCYQGDCGYCLYTNAYWDCYHNTEKIACVDCWQSGNCSSACTCPKYYVHFAETSPQEMI